MGDAECLVGEADRFDVAIYNRFIRWSRLGVFNRIFAELAAGSDTSDRLMIDATHIKAHRTAANLLKKGLYPAVSSAAAVG